MSWSDRVSQRVLALIQLAWIALLVIAFYRENGTYFVTKFYDFLRLLNI